MTAFHTPIAPDSILPVVLTCFWEGVLQLDLSAGLLFEIGKTENFTVQKSLRPRFPFPTEQIPAARQDW
jgi:hypothetical protein